MTVTAGADVGGTTTVAVVAVEGVEVSRATGPGAAVRPGRAMASGSTIGRVVRQALNQAGKLRAEVLAVGAAGVGREEERTALRNALRVEDVADRLVVVTDLEVARVAAFDDQPGIVLLAGTGSVAAGRWPDGTQVRQGGYGWQMGDEGSGHALGRAALVAVGQAADRRAPATALTDLVLRATRTPDLRALVAWSVTAGPPEVAALAPCVTTAAEAGDPAALAILTREAAELSGLVEAMLADWPGTGPVAVALGGSLLRPGGYRELVASRLAGLDRAAPQPGTPDGAAGALQLALRAAQSPPEGR